MKVYLLKPVTVKGEELLPGKDPVEVPKKTGEIWIRLGRASKNKPEVESTKKKKDLDKSKKPLEDDSKKDDK